MVDEMPPRKLGMGFVSIAAVVATGVSLGIGAQTADAATQAPAEPPVVTQTIPVGLGPIEVAVSPRTGKLCDRLVPLTH